MRDSLVGTVLRGAGNIAYYLRECIGEGGQGWVFRANWDDPSGHVVIVKVLRPDVVATEALHRFQREAEVLRMLSTQGRPNPYIVRFYDHAIAQVPSPYGPDPLTLPFTVLEFVDGTTLEKELAKQRATGRGLPAERVRRLLRQICQALDVVHKRKVVHRDLKPSNILLANEAGTEVAKVTDFGLVKLVDVNLQKTSALAGASLGYAPPEQYEQGNERVSPRTDVFSLAAVIFEMLTVKPAFPFQNGENPLLIVTRILNGARPSLMKARAALAPELEASTSIVEALDRELTRALAADPAARHEGVMELWTALEPALRAAMEEHKPPPRSQVSPYETTARVSDSQPPAAAAGGSGVRVLSDNQQPFVATPSAPRMDASHKSAPRADRVAEAEAANPAAWKWAMLTPPLAPQSIRSVVFTATADAAIALTASGLVRWERGAWVPITLPSHVPRGGLRGLRWMRDGSVLVFGAGGFVARHLLGGGTTVWRVPDPEITFLGALVEDNGVTTLVGERPYRGGAVRSFPGNTAGVVTQFNGDRLTVVGDAMSCSRLHGVARLSDGQLVACGDWGAIVRVELGVVEFVSSICAGHLLAIAPLPDGGAVTVGVGGHALSLGPKLQAQLEAVQTTRDLLCLTSTDDGQAWAGSAQARLVRRSALNGTNSWVRISGDIGVTSSMVAIAAGPRTVRAIGDDGTVVEGRLA
ncbi:MAG: serine/threonine protein kinase [Labilithrix sp.]|nr:serine/threonine protein kinase [Labilithrix sp.]MBX3219842.1 serine/threonine protein kinase [Labilithrix sp.]